MNTTGSSLDLDFNEDQCAIADAVASFCADHVDLHSLKQMQPKFSLKPWKALADLGVFSPATSRGEGGALEICAIIEILGRFVFPGPVAATYLATQLLADKELSSLIEGSTMVSLANIGSNKQAMLLPFAEQAKIFLLTDGKNIYRADITDKIIPVQTLGGEPWGRATVKVGAKLANSDRALCLNAISTAAYLSAAGLQLVKESSDYANTRKQFGKTLGEFQGVAHPLADCHISLTAARQLARAAACCFDEGDLPQAQQYSAGARLSANRAALKAAYTCHQIYGGIGITLEGPAFHITRRIRQLVSQAPGDHAAKDLLLKTIGLGVR
jgi:alkylation response protein AidB-like acyl-CoA dehydrogenase